MWGTREGHALTKTLVSFRLMCLNVSASVLTSPSNRSHSFISYFSIPVIKYLNKRNKRVILTHSMLRKSWSQVLEADNHIHRQEAQNDECWFLTHCLLHLHFMDTGGVRGKTVGWHEREEREEKVMQLYLT